MSQADPTPDNNGQNIMELNEQPEAKQKQAIPPRKLREIKHVNYSKYFSEDPDNSEDYQPEESSQKPEPPKKNEIKIPTHLPPLSLSHIVMKKL